MQRGFDNSEFSFHLEATMLLWLLIIAWRSTTEYN